MSQDNNESSPIKDQDAAALLMLFQSQPQNYHRPNQQQQQPSQSSYIYQAPSHIPDKTEQLPHLPRIFDYEVPNQQQQQQQQQQQHQQHQQHQRQQSQSKQSQQPLSSYHLRPPFSASNESHGKEQNALTPVSSANNDGDKNGSKMSDNNTSPGPAVAALTNDDNRGKARIAAAALAAAAATPMPLLNRSHIPVLGHGSAPTVTTQTVTTTLPVQNDQTLSSIPNSAHATAPSPETSSTSYARGPSLAFLLSSNSQESQEGKQAIEIYKNEKIEPEIETPRTIFKGEETEPETEQEEAQNVAVNKDSSAKNENPAKVSDPLNDETDNSSTDRMPTMEKVDSEVETETEAEPKTEEKIILDNQIPHRVDPDSGLIGCICGSTEDDGYTVQCDRCFRWQHVACIDPVAISDENAVYWCYLCNPTAGTRKKRAIQDSKTNKRRRGPNTPPLLDASNEDNSIPNTDNRTKGSRSTTPKAPEERSIPKEKRRAKTIKELEESDDSLMFKENPETLYYSIDSNEYNDKLVKTFVEQLPSSSSLQEQSMTNLSNAKLDKALDQISSRLNVRTYSENGKQKFNGISKLGLFLDDDAEPNSYVISMLGKVEFKQTYVEDRTNQYSIWGVEKPNVFFHPSLPVVFDARGLGGKSRFIRKSCFPNCEIKTVLTKDGKGCYFVVTTTKEIKAGTELTLPWNWDRNSPMRSILEGLPFDRIEAHKKPQLVRAVENILNFCECACAIPANCGLFKVRKATSYLFRSTRKTNQSNLSNGPVNSLNKYDEIYKTENFSDHIPIQTRLRNRTLQIDKLASNETLVDKTESTSAEKSEGDNNGNSLNENAFVNKRSKSNQSILDRPRELLPYIYRILKEAQRKRNSIKDTGTKLSERSNDMKPTIESTSGSIDDFPTPVLLLNDPVERTKPGIKSASPSGKEVKEKKKFSLADYMKKKNTA
ncbi:SET domain-containing protein 3 [Komagataella phaffii CBS 7435]|uniref:SET domain-containing protein 3 n=1 Tax=Komagataella phaffii (strain ATCC 76273 / CBS 7435 / CECT 11047 / NRRL Y-11430 / Wegner 21-1) TaxID=981350 RepID=F2QLR4_KOMPC|nr:GQ67_02287T0 [Komagataella phaffii]AOA65431.1 GQ68_02960T0 [Komagataella phaffii GS115]CAH2445742.1 SET domain-containing protein 3 [Komagataella phaffii CBS 7435]CCA36202.1 SET domain-containing protein 3 [Komagataella phaffii CBS 7435]